MRYRVSPKIEEKRIRMDITVLPSIKAKLEELQGDYSLSATAEDCLVDYFDILSGQTASQQESQGWGCRSFSGGAANDQTYRRTGA